jgi:DNA-binding SARP family transcriptional activator
MDFRILGPLELLSDAGDSIELTRPLMRTVLVALALHRNQSVSQARLIDLLWGPDAEPSDPLHSLRSCIWRIRQELPAGRVVTNEVGYRLRIEAGDRLDLDRFRSLHRQGGAALRDGENAQAVDLLDEALRLWRDPPLSELLPDTPAMGSLMTGLVEEHRDARNRWVRARLALGQHGELLPDLRSWVTSDPANERLWADLMLVLYRCGLTAEALHAFDEARTALAVRAGTEPGVELRRLRQRIQTEDPRLRPGGEVMLRPEEGVWVRLRQLPLDVMDFTGRVGEAGELVELLSLDEGATSVPVIEITGPPGVGKTALAVHVAHLLSAGFPDGQLFLSLTGSSVSPRDPGKALWEVLRGLGVPAADIPEGQSQRTALFRTRLAGRRVLILLDDADSARQVQPLLPGTAGCAVIVTGRARLIGLPGAHHLTLEPLGHEAALSMLARIVSHRRIDAEPEAADAVIDACGGLPLAVRIAGERLASRPGWPIAYLARLLADEKHRLDELVAGDLAVRASIALSYQTLAPSAQRAFRLLALAGPHDFPGWVLDVLFSEPAADVLDTLVDHSLLTTAGVDGLDQPRYRMHDLIREYAIELLTDHPERQDALERLVQAWAELAALAAAETPRIPYLPPAANPAEPTSVAGQAVQNAVADHPRAWFAVERQSLLEAVKAACENGLYRQAARLAVRFAVYLHVDGLHHDAEQMWVSVADAADHAADRPLGRLARLRAATVIGADRGDHERALPLIEDCIAGFDPGADQRILAWAYGLRAYCEQALGDPTHARRDAERGLELARAIPDAYAEFSCLRMLGLALSRAGNHDGGIGCCEQALALARHLGDLVYVRIALSTLTHTRCLAGQHDTSALTLCREGIELAERAGDQLSLAYFHQQAGITYQHLHRHTDAVDVLQRAVEEFGSQRQRRPAARCLRLLADSYHQLGQRTQAIGHIEESIAAFKALGLTEQARQAENILVEYNTSTTES